MTIFAVNLYNLEKLWGKHCLDVMIKHKLPVQSNFRVLQTFHPESKRLSLVPNCIFPHQKVEKTQKISLKTKQVTEMLTCKVLHPNMTEKQDPEIISHLKFLQLYHKNFNSSINCEVSNTSSTLIPTSFSCSAAISFNNKLPLPFNLVPHFPSPFATNYFPGSYQSISSLSFSLFPRLLSRIIHK